MKMILKIMKMVDIKAKRWTENSEWQSKWLLKWHPKDKDWYSRLRKWHKKQRMIPRMVKMTPKIKEWNSLLLKQTSEMIVWDSINESFGKEKLDGIPYLWKSNLSLLLRSKKSMFWHTCASVCQISCLNQSSLPMVFELIRFWKQQRIS